MAQDPGRRLPQPHCTSCGHQPHAGACPSTVDVRVFPSRPGDPVDAVKPCPCTGVAL